MEARKRSLIRRHAYGSATAHALRPGPDEFSIDEGEEGEEPEHYTRGSASASTSSATSVRVWANRRKEHLITRATGERPPPKNTDVALSTVKFVTKLRRSASSNGSRREDGDDTLDENTPEQRAVAHDKTWAQKRKENYMARHGGQRRPVREADAGLQALAFVAKLKRINSDRTSDFEDSETAPSQPPTSAIRAALAKRKENYLARHGVRRKPLDTEVSLSAVTFAAKLKLRQSQASASDSPSAEPSRKLPDTSPEPAGQAR